MQQSGPSLSPALTGYASIGVLKPEGVQRKQTRLGLTMNQWRVPLKCSASVSRRAYYSPQIAAAVLLHALLPISAGHVDVWLILLTGNRDEQETKTCTKGKKDGWDCLVGFPIIIRKASPLDLKRM